MDVSKAIVLLAITGGIVELAKALLPDGWSRNPRVLVGLTVVASFGATFLLRYSVWAHEQVVGGHPLDELSVGSLIVVALSVAGAEAAAFLTLKGAKTAVANVGQNQALPIHEVLRQVGTVPDVHSGQGVAPSPDLEHPEYVFGE